MRMLATAALAFSAAVFLANYALPTEWLFVAAVLTAVPGVLLLLFRRRWLTPIILALLFFSLGLLHERWNARHSLTDRT